MTALRGSTSRKSSSHVDVPRAGGLVKGYSRRTVVRGISLERAQGEIVGLLGPNAAGKTTTVRMFTGEIQAEGGSIWFDDN